jgi:hypothetical protein
MTLITCLAKWQYDESNLRWRIIGFVTIKSGVFMMGIGKILIFRLPDVNIDVMVFGLMPTSMDLCCN